MWNYWSFDFGDSLSPYESLWRIDSRTDEHQSLVYPVVGVHSLAEVRVLLAHARGCVGGVVEPAYRTWGEPDHVYYALEYWHSYTSKDIALQEWEHHRMYAVEGPTSVEWSPGIAL